MYNHFRFCRAISDLWDSVAATIRLPQNRAVNEGQAFPLLKQAQHGYSITSRQISDFSASATVRNATRFAFGEASDYLTLAERRAASHKYPQAKE